MKKRFFIYIYGFAWYTSKYIQEYTYSYMIWKNFVSFVLSVFCMVNVWNFQFSIEGTTLLEIKKSFRDVDNVLYDWTDSPSSDYCVWRGITCDNVTFNVVALWVAVPLNLVYRPITFVPCQEKRSIFIFFTRFLFFAAIFQDWILKVKFRLP